MTAILKLWNSLPRWRANVHALADTGAEANSRLRPTFSTARVVEALLGPDASPPAWPAPHQVSNPNARPEDRSMTMTAPAPTIRSAGCPGAAPRHRLNPAIDARSAAGCAARPASAAAWPTGDAPGSRYRVRASARAATPLRSNGHAGAGSRSLGAFLERGWFGHPRPAFLTAVYRIPAHAGQICQAPAREPHPSNYRLLTDTARHYRNSCIFRNAPHGLAKGGELS